MKIDTKLDIGDTIYFLIQNKVYEGEIEKINATVTLGAYSNEIVSFKYWIKKNPAGSQYTTCFNDYEAFATKEELFQPL